MKLGPERSPIGINVSSRVVAIAIATAAK